ALLRNSKNRRHGLEPKRLSNARRPVAHVEPVPLEQCKRDAFESEADARGMCRRTVGERDVECASEMVFVIIARDAGCRLLLRADGNQQLEFERMLALIGGEHLPRPPEERIVRDIGARGKSHLLQHPRPTLEPEVTVRAHRLWITDANVLALAEH